MKTTKMKHFSAMKENGTWPKDLSFKKCKNNSIEVGPDVKRTNLDLLKFVKSVSSFYLNSFSS